MPLAEVIDRYTIVRLKRERLTDAQRGAEPFLEREFAAYGEAIEEFRGRGVDVRQGWIDELYAINSKCWDMEADIRQGKEGTLGLAEVGRRALILRDFNRERNAVKNCITRETGIGFPEIKVQHGSEDPAILSMLKDFNGKK